MHCLAGYTEEVVLALNRYDRSMWEEIREWAAVVVAAVAIVVSWTSVRHARRATDAAVESAKASRVLADLAESEASRYKIPWRLEHSGKGNKYLLFNDSEDEAVHDVEVAGDVRVTGERDVIGPGESIGLIDVRTLGRHEPLKVTWKRPKDKGEESYSWTSELP
jgi:hypothetical protein